MNKIIIVAAALIVAVHALAGPGSATVEPRTAPEQTRDVPVFISSGPTASPTAIGPYAVGRATVGFVDFTRDNRLLVMDIWYPVQPFEAVGAPPSSYDLVFTGIDSPLAKDGVTAANGPFPLLVFSHGSRGIRFQSFFLTEALASQGYVVVAPDHAGNTAQDLVFDTLDPFEVSAVDRPIDISFTIDKMFELNAQPNSVIGGRVDETRIGVMGHSFGGYTTLAIASGIDEWPRDTRVSVLGAIAPASSINSDAALQSIGLPTLIIGGTADDTTPVEPQSSRPFDLIPTLDRRRVDLLAAGHQSFTNICVFTDALIDAGIDPDFAQFLLGNADQGCAPNLLPIEEAHRLSRLYLSAWFKNYLDGDSRYAKFLNSNFAIGKGLDAEVFEP